MVEVELEVDRLSKLGDGVAAWERRAVFVPGAFAGETVRVRIDPDAKVLRATLLEVLHRSAARRASDCPVSDLCGGCSWIGLSEPVQLEEKERILEDALLRIGRIPRQRLTWLPSISGSSALGYRRRAVLHPVKRPGPGTAWALGFSSRRSHRRVRIERCPVLLPALETAPGELSEALGDSLAEVDEVSVLAVGAWRSFAVKVRSALAGSLVRACERMIAEGRFAGAVLQPTGFPRRVIGRPELKDAAPGAPNVWLYFSPELFCQVNPELNPGLVRSAVDAVGRSSHQKVLELYSGNGNFTFALAAQGCQVTAVESSADALRLARRSADEGRVNQVRFIEGDVPKVCRGLLAERTRFDALLLDPPREGAREIARWADQLGVEQVVYVSCDPATLARDAGELFRTGFVQGSVQLFDLFPQTHHLEAVISLARG